MYNSQRRNGSVELEYDTRAQEAKDLIYSPSDDVERINIVHEFATTRPLVADSLLIGTVTMGTED